MNYSDRSCALAVASGEQTEMNDKNVRTENGVTTVFLFGKRCAVIDRTSGTTVLDGTIRCSRKSTRLYNAILSALGLDCTVKTRYDRWYLKYPGDKYMVEFTDKSISLCGRGYAFLRPLQGECVQR